MKKLKLGIFFVSYSIFKIKNFKLKKNRITLLYSLVPITAIFIKKIGVYKVSVLYDFTRMIWF